MRTFVIALAAVFIASLGLVGAAGAQDAHIGTIDADPATVPEAGEYTLTANGSGWLPDTSILLTACVSPADTLVPGVSDLDTIVAAAGQIEPLSHCDLATAVPIDVDSDGNFTADLTAEVGDNFFFSAGALDGSQAGAAWIPIVDPAAAAAAEEEAAEEEPAEEEAAEEEPAEEEALAETGVETGLLAVVGAAVLGAGVMVGREARRHR
jgi:hypothetical protein